MTKKDYVLIAGVIKQLATENTNHTHRYLLYCVASRLGCALSKDNPRFSFSKFYDACKGDGDDTN